MPGLRFFPAGDQTLQLSLSGLWQGSKGPGMPRRRAGALFGLSYSFL
jgi:hypothetical protein